MSAAIARLALLAGLALAMASAQAQFNLRNLDINKVLDTAKNVVIATGHAMMGLSLGPVSGQLVAQLLSGEKPSFDLSLLRPDRFG